MRAAFDLLLTCGRQQSPASTAQFIADRYGISFVSIDAPTPWIEFDESQYTSTHILYYYFYMFCVHTSTKKHYFTSSGYQAFKDRLQKCVRPSDEQTGYEAARQRVNGTSRSGRGWVYLMKDTVRGFYKIGWTKKKTPKFRESTLQAEVPSIIIVEAWKATPADERECHDRFAAKRLRGEWFDLDASDIQALSEIFSAHKAWSDSNVR